MVDNPPSTKPGGIVLRPLLWLVTFALVAATLAATASAQSGDVKMAVDPGFASAKPGDRLYANLTLHNPTRDALTLALVATPENATALVVKLKESTVSLRAGQTVVVPAAIEVTRLAKEGAHVVTFSARDPLALRDGAASTTMTLRVGSIAPTRVLPTPSESPNEVNTQRVAAPPAPRLSAIELGVAAAAATAGLSFAGLAYAHRKWGWLGLAPLYTRIQKNRVLESPAREALARLVRDEPGISFGDLRRKLNVGAGTLTHHARVLEDAGVVFSSPDGEKKRFFPTGFGRVAPVPSLGERALSALAEGGPCSLSDLSARLGVSRQALHYHVLRLREEGRIVARGAQLAVA